MFVVASDYRKLVQIAAPVAVALLAVSLNQATTQAEMSRAHAGHMLVMPASDGYGFDDCLSSNKACGHVIADAWCEAHGLSAAISFGKAEDITASVADGKVPAKVAPDAYVVSCRD